MQGVCYFDQLYLILLIMWCRQSVTLTNHIWFCWSRDAGSLLFWPVISDSADHVMQGVSYFDQSYLILLITWCRESVILTSHIWFCWSCDAGSQLFWPVISDSADHVMQGVSYFDQSYLILLVMWCRESVILTNHIWFCWSRDGSHKRRRLVTMWSSPNVSSVFTCSSYCDRLVGLSG